MKKVIYPGSFDPITLGHLDIITRSSKLYDEVIVAVSNNVKKKTLFSAEERVLMIEEATSHLDNVKVTKNDKLIVDFAKEQDSKIIIRGLRAVTDFEFEFQMTLANKKLESDIETVFLITDEKYSYVSSSLAKELASFDRDITDFVPKCVCREIKKALKKV